MAQTETNAGGTRVRFQLTRGAGAALGQVEVELFDRDKPDTVRNFLAHVRSGAYARSFLHECLPGVTLSGGEFSVADPTDPNRFVTGNAVPRLRRATNEFRTGPLHRHLFGTLAATKLPGDTNGAAAGWFFNLADNSGTFDDGDDGPTVFGRVVGDTNFLHSFNARARNAGLIDLAATNPASPFASLPVGYNGPALPRRSDLIYVQISVLPVRDTVPPTVTIRSPNNRTQTRASSISVAGKAGDETAINRVWYSVNGGVEQTAIGTTQWVAFVSLQPGTNLIRVESADTTGNRSAPQFRTVYWSAATPVNLSIIGDGNIVGARHGQRLDVNRAYRLTARPDRGFRFTGWTGSLTSASPMISFMMQSNFALTATFVPGSIFVATKGTYNGLFSETNVVRPESAGAIVVTSTDMGRYSGYLRLARGDVRIPFAGRWDSHGLATNIVSQGGRRYRVELMLDIMTGSDRVWGRIVAPTWIAGFDGDRATFSAARRPAPYAGRYTLAMPAETNNPAVPEGDSVGAAKITPAGVIVFAGRLADGTVVAQRVPVSKGGYWPLYKPLYGNRGMLYGWLLFRDDQTNDVHGMVDWLKPRAGANGFYARGFTNQCLAIGSAYRTNPPPLGVASAAMEYSGGYLTRSVTNFLTFGTRNRVTNNGPNQMTCQWMPDQGLFTGAITLPGARRGSKYSGVVLQRQGRGAGYFIEANESGRVRLIPRR